MNSLRFAIIVQDPFEATRITPFGTAATPCEQPAPASTAYIWLPTKATSATPLISGPTPGAVWLEGSPLAKVVRTPAGDTFEMRPPLTGSFVLPVYGPIGGSTWSHWPTVESVPPRPPSATYRFPSGPHSSPRGLLNPVANTDIAAGRALRASLRPFTRAWAVAARAVRAARSETHKTSRLISLPSMLLSPRPILAESGRGT